MATVKGDLRILYIKVSDTYVPIGCLTGNSYSESSETLGTTTRDNAGWTTFRPTNQSYTIEFTGLQDTDSTLTFSHLKTYKHNRTLLQWKLEATDAGLVDYGSGYIVDLGETADAGDLLTFSGTLQGYGKPVELTDNSAPTAPLLDEATLDTANEWVYLTWSGATDDIAVTGYELRHREATTGFTNIRDIGLPTSTPPEYYDKSIAPGISYGYWVRAYDAVGNRSDWSNFRAVAGVTFDSGAIGFQFQDGEIFTTQDYVALQTQD